MKETYSSDMILSENAKISIFWPSKIDRVLNWIQTRTSKYILLLSLVIINFIIMYSSLIVLLYVLFIRAFMINIYISLAIKAPLQRELAIAMMTLIKFRINPTTVMNYETARRVKSVCNANWKMYILNIRWNISRKCKTAS